MIDNEQIDNEQKRLHDAIHRWSKDISKNNKQKKCEGNEEQTKKVLIDYFLEKILKWKKENIKYEPKSGPNGKGGRKADYAFSQPGAPENCPWLFGEAKHAGTKVPSEATQQLLTYAQSWTISYAWWTNGINWIWYKRVLVDGTPNLKEFLSHDVMNPQMSEMRRLLAMSQRMEFSGEEIDQIVKEEVILRLFKDWLADNGKSPSDKFLKEAVREQQEKWKEKGKLVVIDGNITQSFLPMLRKAWSRLHQDTGKNSRSTPKPKPQPGKPPSEKPKLTRMECLLQVMSEGEWLTNDELIKKVRERYDIEILKNTVSKYRSDLKAGGRIEIDRKKGSRLLPR